MHRIHITILTLLIANSLPIHAIQDGQRKDETITVHCARDGESFEMPLQHAATFGTLAECVKSSNSNDGDINVQDCNLNVSKPFLQFMRDDIISHKLPKDSTLPTALVDFRRKLANKDTKETALWLHDLDESKYGESSEHLGEHTQKKTALAAALTTNFFDKKKYDAAYTTPNTNRLDIPSRMRNAITNYIKQTKHLQNGNSLTRKSEYFLQYTPAYHIEHANTPLTDEEISHLACFHTGHLANRLTGIEFRTNKEAVKELAVTHFDDWLDHDKSKEPKCCMIPEIFPNVERIHVDLGLHWCSQIRENLKNTHASNVITVRPTYHCTCPEEHSIPQEPSLWQSILSSLWAKY